MFLTVTLPLRVLILFHVHGIYWKLLVADLLVGSHLLGTEALFFMHTRNDRRLLRFQELTNPKDSNGSQIFSK